MSLAQSESNSSDSLASHPLAQHTSAEPSFLESFLSSFFQEKNIKWILVVGASIVFGSSLMLVTKAWPNWPPELKYVTILGYTTVIFAAAELSRRRLRLNATYRVLQSLTLLLLPICFLSLTWLSSGTATSSGLATVWHIGLMIPALALLWHASSTILDHWLRSRQTTFLVSFNLLCIAGALPQLTTPVSAFALMAVCWMLFTAGVVKVNRHTFWLAEEHQWPRIFGFLPIAMLGLQFVVLVGVKSLDALPVQWIGFAIVMVAATVLSTTRTVADVFRRRSGDLVRPLPWAIVLPLFVGLVLVTLGVGLAFSGFSYVGTTTYAIIPTSVVAAILFGWVARDTRHPGFVWASLFMITIAYQCSPTLFSNLVQTLRSVTADAINQERVPLSMYGLTYMPLLGILVFASRRFASQQRPEFSQPIKHFVSGLAGMLSCLALTDIPSLSFVSPFLVASANTFAFIAFAIVLRDRRYVLPAIVALVVAVATAIPGLNQMQYASIHVHWVPTLLSGLALLMTTFGFPDRLVQRIPARSDFNGLLRSDATGRNLFQGAGWLLAIGLAAHWTVSSTVSLIEPLSLESLVQYCFLLAAMLIYTVRNPQYLSAASVWVLVAIAALRWAIGQDVSWYEMAKSSTYLFVGCSAASYFIIKFLKAKTPDHSLQTLRQSLGFDGAGFQLNAHVSVTPTWQTLLASFTVSLFDLSVVVMSLLVAMFHLPLVFVQHLTLLSSPFTPVSDASVLTPVAMAWLLGVAYVLRNRLSGFAAAMLAPLFTTSMLVSAGVVDSITWTLVAWAATQGLLLFATHWVGERRGRSSSNQVMQSVCQAWLLGLLLVSCVSLEFPLRIVAVIALALLGGLYAKQWHPQQFCGIAILGNINLLLLVASLAGCSGLLVSGTMFFFESQSIAFLFLAGCVSVLFFDRPSRRIACDEASAWAMALRFGVLALMLGSFMETSFASIEVIAMLIGCAFLIAAEILAAVKQNNELRVWTACGVGVVATGFLFAQNVISIGSGASQFVLLGLSVAGLTIAWFTQSRESLRILRRPMLVIGHSLPAVVACLALTRELFGSSASAAGLNSLSLMIAAGIYFHQAFVLRRSVLCIPAVLIVNAALFLMWLSLGWNAPELYLVPVGLSVLAFVELMKKELPAASHDPLRYIAALAILCSPLFEVLGGSWAHMFALMLLSVLVIFAAIGLRISSLVYAGSAFLLADLVAMVVRSTIHNVNLLWVCGVVLGIGVIALAAFFENHRDKLLSRIRIVSAELATWN